MLERRRSQWLEIQQGRGQSRSTYNMLAGRFFSLVHHL